MHKNSHTISKSKPKIRIIHIFAPEIIKTDAANFRELVQRLTGKPTADDHRNINCCSKTRILRKKEQRVLSSSNKKMEELNQFPFLEGTTQINDAYGGDQPQLA
ncbi:UNVERIFIED_CONTAM: VQ motif-containing protein 25 [Sesamum radiatum]|uniref:VQ motif-containing protein 25 n=1 Tax=Sesamum radiatum TaxID=300843 RepID=A0AAW2N744_SESRA